MRDARGGRPGDDVAGTKLVLLRLRPSNRPELERAVALEHDKRLGLARVAVRWAAALAGLAPDPVQAGTYRAGRRGEHLVAVLVERHVVKCDDVRRPLARVGELELADHGFDVPRVVGSALDPRVPEPQRAGARQPAELHRMARSEDEGVEPVGAALEGALVVVG